MLVESMMNAHRNWLHRRNGQVVHVVDAGNTDRIADHADNAQIVRVHHRFERDRQICKLETVVERQTIFDEHRRRRVDVRRERHADASE